MNIHSKIQELTSQASPQYLCATKRVNLLNIDSIGKLLTKTFDELYKEKDRGFFNYMLIFFALKYITRDHKRFWKSPDLNQKKTVHITRVTLSHSASWTNSVL